VLIHPPDAVAGRIEEQLREWVIDQRIGAVCLGRPPSGDPQGGRADALVDVPGVIVASSHRSPFARRNKFVSSLYETLDLLSKWRRRTRRIGRPPWGQGSGCQLMCQLRQAPASISRVPC